MAATNKSNILGGGGEKEDTDKGAVPLRERKLVFGSGCHIKMILMLANSSNVLHLVGVGGTHLFSGCIHVPNSSCCLVPIAVEPTTWVPIFCFSVILTPLLMLSCQCE